MFLYHVFNQVAFAFSRSLPNVVSAAVCTRVRPSFSNVWKDNSSLPFKIVDTFSHMVVAPHACLCVTEILEIIGWSCNQDSDCRSAMGLPRPPDLRHCDDFGANLQPPHTEPVLSEVVTLKYYIYSKLNSILLLCEPHTLFK